MSYLRSAWMPLTVASALVALQLIILLTLGQPWICACGYVELWHAPLSGPGTSQHLTDWYSYSHVLHGFAFYFALMLIAPKLSFAVRIVLAIGIEAGWEMVENTPFVIERYRQTGIALGYFGDSVVNSLTDTAMAALGFVLARFTPTWLVIVVAASIEILLAYVIRDNLTLNIIQLIHPLDAITRWQTAG